MASSPPAVALGRRLTAERRREILLAAACKVFAAHGFHGASIDEIAKEAAITKPVIYHHFASKRDLHSAVFEHYAEQLLTAAASHGLTGTLPERLHDIVAGMFTFAHANPDAWRLLLGDATDPETALLQQRLRAAGTHVSAARLLREPGFKPKPGLSRSQAAEVIAQLTRSAVDGLVNWSLTHPKVSRAHLIATATDVLWAGLTATIEYEQPG
jgi:AcrR family transcriptional regulator